MIIYAHVRLGRGREVVLERDDLLATMDRLGIERALVAPDERCIAVDNREGNELVAAAAAASDGRLMPYAVANPWRGARAVDELHATRDLGDERWDELCRHLSETERIELPMLVGHYEMLAMTLNSLRVEPDKPQELERGFVRLIGRLRKGAKL